MAGSLRWQILWPQGVLLAAGIALVAAELDNRARMANRYEAIDQMRGRLDRSTLRLSERHIRTMHRAREALLEPSADNRSSSLAWTADPYLSDMERFVDEASKSLRAVRVPDAAPRLDLDLRRLEKQLERVLAQAQTADAALSSLVEAAALQEATNLGRGRREAPPDIDTSRPPRGFHARPQRIGRRAAASVAEERPADDGEADSEQDESEDERQLSAEDERGGSETAASQADGGAADSSEASGDFETQPASAEQTDARDASVSSQGVNTPSTRVDSSEPATAPAGEERREPTPPPAIGRLAAVVGPRPERSPVDEEAAEAMRKAQQRLERADRSMHTSLRIVDGMVRRAVSLQARHAAEPIDAPPLGLWLVVACLVPLVLWLTQRCAGRLRALAAGAPVRGRCVSTEEQGVVAQVDSLRGSEAQLEARLRALTHEAGRAEKRARRAASELALLHLYNENLVNSLRSAVVVTDAAGAITSFNRPARTLLAMTESELGTCVDEHPLHHTLAGRSPDIRADLARSMTDRRPLRFDGVSYGAGGKSLLLDLTIAPYQDESGAARGLLWVVDDVTEQVQTKTQLLAAERLAAIGRLSAQVAHEIRNPLSAIALNAELLEDEIGQSVSEQKRGEASQLLRAIASEIERLTEVTEGYLQLARMPHPTFREVDLNRLVSELLSMLGEEMKVHGVAVSLDLATPVPTAWADPGQLRQALLNIVRNSREAMGGGGQLRISTGASDTEAQVEITDTGPGIPAEVLPRVFEPFYSTKPDGTGLGLSLTQQIVAEHGGTIEILPVTPNGARTILSLPRKGPVQDTP